MWHRRTASQVYTCDNGTQHNCLSLKQVSIGTSEAEVEEDDRIKRSEEPGPVGNDSGVGAEDSKEIRRSRGRKNGKQTR